MDHALHHLIDNIRSASAERRALHIQAGGSKNFYGASITGAPLDVRPLTGIVSYEPSELVVTVRAGTPLAELEAALAEKGQCLPFEPPHFGFSPGAASVGGMVAAGFSGPSRASVGPVRDYVLGLQMVNGKAEHLTFGGQVMKNVAGYDVSRLMVGSWGMLGVITEVSLKVLPFAPAQATLRFAMDEATMLHQLNVWGGQSLPLNASSWVIDNGQPTLYLRLRGAVAAVEAACQRLLAEIPGQRVDSQTTAADWTAARDLRLPWFTDGFARGDDLWRLSVPQTAPALNVGDTMVDWLGAQRWVWAAHGDPAAAQRLHDAAQKANGGATLFIAARAYSTMPKHSFMPLKPPLNRVHHAVKAEFDPQGIFNPGRMPWFGV